MKTYRVAILTVQKVQNYGTQLQMLSLRNIIQNFGYKCDIIDYKIGSQSYSPTSKVDRLKPLKNAINSALYARKKKKFTEFRKQLTFTKPIYTNEQLISLDKEYDAFVCGSDQIWNPEFTGLDDNYYLGFSLESKRIAYAASIGIDEPEKKDADFLLAKINSIPHISVREKTAQEWLNSKIDRQVMLTLDPTLLQKASFWRSIANAKQERPKCNYIVLYDLKPNRDSELLTAAKRMAVMRNFKIINLAPRIYDILNTRVENKFSAAPDDFLTVIKDAQCVITNSYHGMLFSIIFKVPFWVHLSSYGKRPISSRIRTVLQLLDLEDRIINFSKDNCWNNLDIDYCNVHRKLNYERENSLQWLKNKLYSVTTS